MTGRANRYKGVDFAISCFAEIVHRRGVNDLHFLFCGDGPDLEFFKLMVKDLNLEKNVTFAGHVKGIAEILAACDFAFHPSQGEVGYSLSILEYMRAALPVVVPDNPSVCSSIVQNETGLIYSEMKLEKCVQALIELYQDKALRKSISTKAMSAFNNNYTLKNTHKQLISTIQKVISQHE
jgi:glycosyltransferase involved in cell wall biosynthesis